MGDADSLASRDNIGGKDIKTEEKEKKGVEREDTGKQHERSWNLTSTKLDDEIPLPSKASHWSFDLSVGSLKSPKSDAIFLTSVT